MSQGLNSPELLTDLAIALKMQGRSSQAIHYLQLALKLRYMPGTYALLAEEKCKTRDLEGARPMLARILREELHDTHILSLVAHCYLESDQPLESVEVYRALRSDPSFPGDVALLQLTKAYLKAAQFFFQRLNAAPGNNPYVEAMRQARDAGSSDARGSFAVAAKASPYFHADFTYQQALEMWRKHSDDPALLYQLSVLSGEESMRQVAQCEKDHPVSPYLEQFHADVLADQGREDEAVEIYEQLMQKHPDLAELRYSLGMLYRNKQEWRKSLVLFQQQLAADPADERAAAHASEALVELERYEELKRFLAPIVSAKNAPLWARLDLASAEQKLGNFAGAIQQLNHAEKENAADKTIHYRLMRLYTQTGDSASALREKELFRQSSK